MIERHHLEILRAVERQGSLTAAAEQLHLTQSALSHAMRKLEQQLGTPVWLREGRQLRFTQAGNQLLALQSQQLGDLAAAIAAQGRAEMLEAARAAAAEAEGRERFRRFRKGH